ncbi:MAG TPA: beta-propeller fold lactonase family protein [Streptosporangiaceae bacterium]|nr:beta-propeller fold lactonase family protein [Streptosporangiaceae bacterium]
MRRRMVVAVSAVTATVIGLGLATLSGLPADRASALTATALTASASGAAARTTVGARRTAPQCNAIVARAPTLGRIATKMLQMPGPPFGVAVTPNGRWDLAAGGGLVVVVRNTGSGERVAHVIKLPPGQGARGVALTPDGKYLLVADLRAGAVVIDVARAIAGKPDAVLGTLDAPAPAQGAFEVAFSADGRFAFVTIAGDQEVAVFNLGLALSAGFGLADYVGAIPAGQSNVGIATSPDYRWLYVTSEASSPTSKHGTLSVVSMAKAQTDPAHSVVSTVDAGCRPVRVFVPRNGKTVWVSARQSNAVLAFSASRLLTDPRHALITWVRVGVQPIGLVTVNCGSQLIVADSHRFKSNYGPPSLAVVNVHAALTGHPALVGYLQTGLDPRQLAVAPNGRLLLVGNFGSGQLETVTLTHLPGASNSCRAANDGR